ncbi:MAG: FAD-dependent oxidoreductase, partial [Silicimonas sp.]|nr:FAD-dependent oxidoreductase [Silicimonas sp.]
MNPLYKNDRPGVFPESYFAATTDIPAERPPLDGDRRADLVVIGG